jgi:hypothetical protein
MENTSLRNDGRDLLISYYLLADRGRRTYQRVIKLFHLPSVKTDSQAFKKSIGQTTLVLKERIRASRRNQPVVLIAVSKLFSIGWHVWRPIWYHRYRGVSGETDGHVVGSRCY